MILEKGSFSIFPSNMCKGLPAYEQIVFIWICHHSNAEGQCFPSLNTLAEECGVSKDTITRSIKKLEGRGYITKIIRMNEKGENISNLYTIILSNANSGHLAADVDNPLAANSGHLAADVDTNYTQLTKPNIELNKNISSSEDERLTSFNKFWNIYPRRQAKKAAQTKWMAKKCHLKEVEILDDIDYRLKNYQPNGWLDRKSGLICDPVYIPLATTYLNQERWDDEEVIL